MCEVCHLVLRKLIDRGLVSEGNVKEQQKEIIADMEKALMELSAEEMVTLKVKERKGFDA